MRLSPVLAVLAVLAAFACVCHARPVQDAAKPLRVVTDNNFPPYAFVNDDGKLVGYEVDLWKLWEHKTGRKVDLIGTSWDHAQARIADGSADVIDLIYLTPQRAKTLDFSPPYGRQEISIFAKSNITGLNDISALKGFTVGVERGDACIEHLRADGIVNLKLYADYKQLIQAAMNDQVPAFCMDDKPAHYYLYKNHDDSHFTKAFDYYVGHLRFAVRKGDLATLALVEHGMHQISPEQRKKLHDKWMGSNLSLTPYARIFGIALLVMIVLGLLALVAIRALRAAIAHKTGELKNKNTQLELSSKVFQSTGDGVVITDAHCRILTVNDAFTRITGYSTSEAEGQTPAFLHAAGNEHSTFASIWANGSTPETWQGEVACRRKDGEIFSTWWKIHVARDPESAATHYVAVFSDISRINHYKNQVEYLTYHDLVTELANRSLLMDRLKNFMARARLKGRQLALMVIGLENFKRINATLGHSAGDIILKTVAQRIRGSVRRETTVARMGGDEFAVVFQDTTDVIGLTRQAERLVKMIGEDLQLDGQHMNPRVYIGIAIFPEDGNEALSLLKNADVAMHAAKQQSGLKLQFYDDALTSNARTLLELERDLSHALEHGQFELVYQPQWDARSGAITTIEVLVRWNRPHKGPVPPDQFIPFAEESGLIVPLGSWILETACRQFAEWVEQGVPDITLAVNISARQIETHDLVAEIQHLLQTHHLPPGRLELEITESQLVQDISGIQSKLRELGRLGVRVAIDDFGTGYSSLAYLRHLPAHVLKIDKSFIDEIPDMPDAIRIVAAIISMAHALNMQVVAEGVETATQAELLATLGCDRMQGYFKSAPIPASALLALLPGTGKKP